MAILYQLRKTDMRKIILLLALFYLASSQTEAADPQPSKTHESYLSAELHDLENAEIAQLLQAIDENERIKKYKALLSQKPHKGYRVAVLGQTALELSSKGFNPDILSELLNLIKESQPKAVFFAGDVVYSLISEEEKGSGSDYTYVDFTSNKNIFHQVIEKEKGYYNAGHFKEVLNGFASFVREHLGPDVAIYPIMGAQESIGPQTAEIFRDVFQLNKATLLPSNQLVYSVVIDNALYILLSTDYFDKTTGQPKTAALSAEALDWLNQVLENQAPDYDYVFVIAGDPVFSTTASFGINPGLNINGLDRDKFWDLLRKYNVRAYICGEEVLYDRSYKRGVWQIITGGGGALRDYLSENNDTFYHFVLLNIPLQARENPLVQVYSNFGENDQFELSQTPPFLYQYRMSRE